MWPILPRPFSRPIGRVAEGTTNWTPRIDAFEKDGNLVVKADLPGVKQEDIKVTIEDNSLVIEGERKTESEVKEENYFRSERVYGHFYRYIPLDFEASPDQVKASFKDGVLEVRVPRPEPRPSSARSIPVSS
jgi:HSP20 family protein